MLVILCYFVFNQWLVCKYLSCRGRIVGPVQDLVMYEVHGKQLLFVLHSDGILRVWDSISHSRIFSHTMSIPELAGTFYYFFFFFLPLSNLSICSAIVYSLLDSYHWLVPLNRTKIYYTMCLGEFISIGLFCIKIIWVSIQLYLEKFKFKKPFISQINRK